MPLDPQRTCPCHGEPMYHDSRRHYCNRKRLVRNRIARRRYRLSPKGLQQHRDAERRSPAKQARNKRRLWIGQQYAGIAATSEAAACIRAYIKERTLEFIARQSSRAEAESDPLGAIPAETAPRNDRLA